MELWTAFVLGMVGSLHCAGMCGPLVLALPAGSGSTTTFLAGRAVYNSGRILTYCMLGAIFGFFGHTLFLAGVQRWASMGLGILLIAGLVSSRRVILWQPLTVFVEKLKAAMASLLRRRSLASLGILGLLNGLLPCGLVYVACAAATSTSHPLSGAKYMAAFGAGTVPMLLALSLSGRLVPIRLRLQIRKAIPVSVFVLASLLILRGLSLGIPFLSPDLTAANPSCCHR